MFKLYTEEKSTFMFGDYRALMDIVHDLGAKSVLEFGPGISTRALIEAGVERIVTAECHEGYRKEMAWEFIPYPQVEVVAYENLVPVAKLELPEGTKFDMAFVDSPRGGPMPGQSHCSRLNTVLCALRYAPIVYLHDACRQLERVTLAVLEGLGHGTETHPSANMARIDRNTVEKAADVGYCSIEGAQV